MLVGLVKSGMLIPPDLDEFSRAARAETSKANRGGALPRWPRIFFEEWDAIR